MNLKITSVEIDGVLTPVAYTDDQVGGAIPNGSRVVKITQEEGDRTPAGAGGTVVGSIEAEGTEYDGELGYFLYWDDLPGVPVFVRGYKIREAR